MMDSVDVQYGFDVNFVDEVPDNLKCVVCHLVMRQPVQIMTCGHRFCKPCFERIQGYSKHLNTQLCCPFDREAIDISKVFDDTAISRDISNLKVRCSHLNDGCSWKGDLRNLQGHEEECKLQSQIEVLATAGHQESSMLLIKEICQRLARCEDCIAQKEKDIAYLKYNLQDLKTRFETKEKEVDLLKIKNDKLEIELHKRQEENFELKKQCEKDTENISLKYQLLGKKVECLEREEIASKKLIPGINDDIEKLKKEVFNACAQAKETKKVVHKSLSKMSEDTKGNEGNIVNLKTNSDEVKINLNSIEEYQKSVDEANKNIGVLELHLANLENILFCDVSAGKKDIIIQWKLQNCQQHFNSGKALVSPVSLTEIHGYSFKLFIKWHDVNKEYMGLYLRICRAKGHDEELKPFNIPYALEMVAKTGKILSREVPASDLNEHRIDAFSIPLGANCAKIGWGFPKYLSQTSLKDYVVNDMITIQCRLSPQ